ncbi:unnamed protein product [Moneuplotes crassus]|uniref:Uncharacterized protein n=1 Tax=Euplotes crassus TaxID=5936 RepID=A0AAD2D559_EUPCR|nr:unnamed protein product [Moneuplotes crassus]
MSDIDSPKVFFDLKKKLRLKPRTNKFGVRRFSKKLNLGIKFNKRAIRNIRNIKSPPKMNRTMRLKKRNQSVDVDISGDDHQDSSEELAKIHQNMIFKCQEKLQLSKYLNGRFFSPQRLTQKAMIVSFHNRKQSCFLSNDFLGQEGLPQIRS